jgi:hypothetical protein
MLMSDAGDSSALNNATLTFGDEGAVPLPDSTGITSGTYRPSDYVTGDFLPAPAPAGPFGTALSVFNGLDPNGTWRLFVYDDSAGDSGQIAQGWSLQLTTRRAPDPVILEAGFSGDWFQFRFLAVAGRNYLAEYQDALDDVAWQYLQWAPGDGTVQTITDYTPGPGQRFYRLRVE